ncbi:hypothetical protein GGR51DRAFT_516237, partial [Nemania sp. FL0031]
MNRIRSPYSDLLGLSTASGFRAMRICQRNIQHHTTPHFSRAPFAPPYVGPTSLFMHISALNRVWISDEYPHGTQNQGGENLTYTTYIHTLPASPSQTHPPDFLCTAAPKPATKKTACKPQIAGPNKEIPRRYLLFFSSFLHMYRSSHLLRRWEPYPTSPTYTHNLATRPKMRPIVFPPRSHSIKQTYYVYERKIEIKQREKNSSKRRNLAFLLRSGHII